MTLFASYTHAGVAAAAPFAGQPVEVPAPPPDSVPLPPAPHPPPPGPEPVPPEIDEPPLPPGVSDPVKDPDPAPHPISAATGFAASSRGDDPARNTFRMQQRCVAMVWNQTSHLLALLASDGMVRHANPAWRVMLGYDPVALVGSPMHELVHHDDVPVVLAILLRPDRSSRSETVSRWRLADGSGYRAVAWVRCVDGDKVAFSGRLVAGEGCDSTGPGSSADAGLAQAQRLRAVGRMCGGVSQEFNNLLQSLRHSLELIRRHPDDAEQVRQLAERAISMATTGSRMTAQLLEFVGLQRGRSRALQTSGLLVMRTEMRQRLGPAVEIEMTGFEDGGWVLCVPDRLREALNNLAVNASEAMAGRGKLLLRCERVNLERDAELPSGAYVQISVQDQGPGIAEALRESVCEPFFSTKAVGEGPGLGLSQVYGFARFSGGALRIDSRQQGRGANLRLLLPAAAAPGNRARHRTEQNVADSTN